MEEKDILMKHSTTFVNELYSSVSAALHHMWKSLNLEVPKDKEEILARIMAKIIEQIAHGNPNISRSLMENIKSNFISKDGAFEFTPTSYGTKDQDSFNKKATVLTGGKVLKIDESTEAKETDMLTAALQGLVSGKLTKDDFEKSINDMVSNLNSGIMPPGVDPNDPKSIAANTKTLEQEIPAVPNTNSNVAEKSLLEEIGDNLLQAELAKKLIDLLDNSTKDKVIERAVKKITLFPLGLLYEIIKKIKPEEEIKLKSLMEGCVEKLKAKLASGPSDDKHKEILNDITISTLIKLKKITQNLVDEKNMLENHKIDGSLNEKLETD